MGHDAIAEVLLERPLIGCCRARTSGWNGRKAEFAFRQQPNDGS